MEIAYAVAYEGALHVDDVLTRRTRISIEYAHRGADSAESVGEQMAALLGWDDETREREVRSYIERVEAERRSQTRRHRRGGRQAAGRPRPTRAPSGSRPSGRLRRPPGAGPGPAPAAGCGSRDVQPGPARLACRGEPATSTSWVSSGMLPSATSRAACGACPGALTTSSHAPGSGRSSS